MIDFCWFCAGNLAAILSEAAQAGLVLCVHACELLQRHLISRSGAALYSSLLQCLVKGNLDALGTVIYMLIRQSLLVAC